MAQLLITHASDIHIYSPIASIKKYTEPQFEEKLFRYSKAIFKNYYVFKFKYPLSCPEIPGATFEPDLLLVSKTFKKWILLEVELCMPPKQHTLDQITCFSNPRIKPDEIVDFLIRNNPEIASEKQSFLDCFTNYKSDLLVVMDDYSDKVFQKLYEHKRQLKVCVLEVYRKAGYSYDGYRFGGDYPYELTNSSKLQYIDSQHYKIQRKDFLKDLPDSFELKFDMDAFDASLIKMNRQTTYLKLPEHNIPSDVYLQIGKNLEGEYIIQKL